MIEHIYELTNFPSIKEILKDPEIKFVNYSIRYDYTEYPTPYMENILNLNLLDHLGIKWKNFIYFKKDDFVGKIHTDLADMLEEVDSTRVIWGINWIYDGDCVMKFWPWDSVVFNKKQSVTGRIVAHSPVLHVTAKTYPSHVYKLYSGKVYLVNATVPHQAIGGKNRSVLSLRNHSLSLSWEEVLEKFKDYCIKVNHEVVV